MQVNNKETCLTCTIIKGTVGKYNVTERIYPGIDNVLSHFTIEGDKAYFGRVEKWDNITSTTYETYGEFANKE